MPEKKFYADQYDAIVIGGAVAGMACAINLAREGMKVLILERHNLPGGVVTSFSRSGVEMEATLHEMMSIGPKEKPLFIREYLEEIGIDLDWLRVPEAYRLYVPEDKIDITLHAGKDENGVFLAAKEIEEKYPGNLEKVDRLLKLCEEVYNTTLYLNDHSPSKLTLLKEHEGMAKTAGYSAKEVMDALEIPEVVQSCLSAYWIYVGQPISTLPFTIYSFLMGDYMTGGSYVLRGFSHELAVAMAEKARELGVQIEYGQNVEKILVKDRQVYGVRTSRGDEIHSRYVVSAPYQDTVYKKMIEPASEVPPEAFKLVNGRRLGVSVFSVILQLEGKPEDLNIHDYSVFSADSHFDTDKFWEGSKKLGGWDFLTTICLNYANPEGIPEGTTSLSITALPLPEAFFGVTADDYRQTKRKLAKELIERVSKHLGVNLLDHIIDLEIEAPMSVAHYTGMYRGCVYGYQHHMEDSIVARLPRYGKEHYIHGLTWAAAHALTGDGVAININNGRIAAKVVMEWEHEAKEGK